MMKSQPPMLVYDFFETVYKPLRLLQASPGTVQQYRIAVVCLDRFLDRRATLADLTEENVTGLMASILADGRSPVTANMKMNYLKTLARLAKRKGYIDADLSAVDKLRVNRRLPTAWSNRDMEKIIESCRVAEGRIGGVPAAAWWVAFVLIAYDTGLRRRALMAIRFDELDFETGILRVPAENMKTAVEQCFKLHPQTIDAILATVPPDRELVFPIHYLHARCFYVRFKVILKRAGLPFTGRDMVHKLRRTCASHIAARAGEALAIKQLGHLDPSCIKRYVDPTFTASHDLVGLLPRPSWLNPREVVVTRDDGPVYHLGQPLKIVLPADGLGHAGAMDRIMRSNEMDAADLREAIAETGLSVDEFATEAKVSQAHLYRIIAQEQPLTRDMERRLRLAFGMGPRPSKGAKRDTVPRGQRLRVAPPPGTRPEDHPLLDADPISLIPEFVAERLTGPSRVYNRRMQANLRTMLLVDGALRVRDLDPEATVIHVTQRQQAGDIGPRTVEGCRTAMRQFIAWLVEQRGVHHLGRVRIRLDRHLTKAARMMTASRKGEGAA
jgi:integrase